MFELTKTVKDLVLAIQQIEKTLKDILKVMKEDKKNER